MILTPDDLYYSQRQRQEISKRFLYRVMNKYELYNLFNNKVIETDMFYGISFAKNKAYANQTRDLIHKSNGGYFYPPTLGDEDENEYNDDFVVTFNRSILEQNFPMIELEYTKEFFINHPKIAWNYLGLAEEEWYHNGNDSPDGQDYRKYVKILKYLYPDKDFSNLNDGEAYSIILKYHMDDPSIITKFPIINGLKFDDIFKTSYMSEVLMEQNHYHFISGMIENVESFYHELLDELYNFLKDKLK
jgi:hypothetical protein